MGGGAWDVCEGGGVIDRRDLLLGGIAATLGAQTERTEARFFIVQTAFPSSTYLCLHSSLEKAKACVLRRVPNVSYWYHSDHFPSHQIWGAETESGERVYTITGLFPDDDDWFDRERHL